MKQKRILVTTAPFAQFNRLPLERLEDSGFEVIQNPYGRKIRPDELFELICDVHAVIAGTELIPREALVNAKKLELISRVGIGLDGIDLQAARDLGIRVSYTPDAPAPAVAELTICMILNLLRNVHIANHQMHAGRWNRYFGKRVAETTIGVIGVGRIGGRVIRRLAAFGSPRILVNDLTLKPNVCDDLKLEWVDKETIYRESDVISVHVPLTNETHNLIAAREINLMKDNAVLINSARGGIVNEADLADALVSGKLAGAAIDVFENEPYEGALCDLENCILTSHMGSMTHDCRSLMEIQATEEVIWYLNSGSQQNKVPEEEYLFARSVKQTNP